MHRIPCQARPQTFERAMAIAHDRGQAKPSMAKALGCRLQQERRQARGHGQVTGASCGGRPEEACEQAHCVPQRERDQ